VPEHKWRHFQSCLKRTLKVKPAHLLVFLLLRHEEKVYLQYRMKENCGGEFDRYGLLPGKVNDVDFYPDGAAMQHHMEAVQKLQMTWHGLDQSAARIPREVVRQVTELAAAFRRECGLTSDAVGEAELVAACIKAARRTFREKLGADIPSDSPLIPNDGRFIVSRNDHELVIKLIVLDIDERTALRIVESNPFQRIEPKTRAEIRRLDRASKLTEFLHQNLNRVLELAFG
jgi:hypothetical protein